MLRQVMAFPVTWPGVTRLGQKPLAAVRQDDVEAFIRHVASVRSASTRNHYVQLARAMSTWAVKRGYRTTPFADRDSDIIRRKKVHRIKTIRTAWRTAVLKAHGHEPEWVPSKRAGKGLGTPSAKSRAAYRAIDLHFHDMRHEAGSRLIEAGWPLHEVQQMLGHASLEQTSTYLNATLRGLHRSMRALDQARGQQPPAEDKSAQDQPGVSGSACKDVASDTASAPLTPCKALSGSDDKSLIH